MGAPPTLEIRLLGGFDVRVDGRPLPPLRSRREQWLLALLVLRSERDTAREWLATALWPDNDEAQALFYLRKALSHLRHALGPQAARLLAPTPRTVRLEMADAYADVLAFDRALAAGALPEAIALYRGPLLADCPAEWATAERTAREQAYLSALEALAARLQAQGDPAGAAHWLRRLTAADPYRESAYRLLMEALADCGDAAAVTLVYQELRARLRHDLNAAPAPETEALVRQLRERRPAAPPPTAPRASRRHLPVPLSDLIGRQTEIAEVLAWLESRRLVTLLGAGGVGKTRLAIAVAEAALPHFDRGVWFVDLAALSDPGLVPQTVAKALGVAEEPGRAVNETLADALAADARLLVLDNCEHLLEACATLAHHLLSACPTLHILATSRQALDLMGEQVYRVLSLLVPPHDADPDGLMAYEAIQLFVDRAGRVNGAFRFHERNAPDIAEICRQLDGIPLAIEMAAARLRSLSVSEINARLEDRFHLLTSGNRGVLPRQQTLRAAIDWSYDLLAGPERALLRRLSVFAGGWTTDAAEQVCAAEPVAAANVRDLLASLSDKSLLIAQERPDAVRFRLLETVRQYAQDRLAESGETETFRRRHLQYVLALAREAQMVRLETEHDNVRAALGFAVQEAREPESGLALCDALLPFWAERGHFVEGRSWCRSALERAPQTTALYAAVLNAAGVLASNQGDFDIARNYHAQSLAIRRQRGDRSGISRSLNSLGMVACSCGDYDGARDLYEQSLAIKRELGDRSGIADSLNNLGVVACLWGDYAAARSLYEEALAIRREQGALGGVALALNNLGDVAYEQGDYETARPLLEESLALRRALEDWPGIAESLMDLGSVAYEQGDHAGARSHFQESLSIARRLGRQQSIVSLLTAIGDLEAHTDPARAARLWGAAEALRTKIGAGVWPTAQMRQDARVAAARARLGDADRFADAWAEGRALPSDQAVDCALGRDSARTT